MDIIDTTGYKEHIDSFEMQGSNITDAEQFMRRIISKATSTNSQLSVTGNAFNKLFEGKV